jgi:hypothetical protein
MAQLTRQEVLDVLQGNWAEYVHGFCSLPVEEQSVFLRRQGYARFADLLAHIVSWWRVCHQAVERYVSDPGAQPIHYDVDAFNAEAVAAVSWLEEEQVVESFEMMRHFMVEFVKDLPGTAFENEKVVDQLEMDFFGHLHEHAIERE